LRGDYNGNFLFHRFLPFFDSFCGSFATYLFRNDESAFFASLLPEITSHFFPLFFQACWAGSRFFFRTGFFPGMGALPRSCPPRSVTLMLQNTHFLLVSAIGSFFWAPSRRKPPLFFFRRPALAQIDEFSGVGRRLRKFSRPSFNFFSCAPNIMDRFPHSKGDDCEVLFSFFEIAPHINRSPDRTRHSHLPTVPGIPHPPRDQLLRTTIFFFPPFFLRVFLLSTWNDRREIPFVVVDPPPLFHEWPSCSPLFYREVCRIKLRFPFRRLFPSPPASGISVSF